MGSEDAINSFKVMLCNVFPDRFHHLRVIKGCMIVQARLVIVKFGLEVRVLEILDACLQGLRGMDD